MCNGVNSLYILIVQSCSLQSLLYKVVLLTDQNPGFSCLRCISKTTFWLRFVFRVAESALCVCCIINRSAAPTDNGIYKPL